MKPDLQQGTRRAWKLVALTPDCMAHWLLDTGAHEGVRCWLLTAFDRGDRGIEGREYMCGVTPALPGVQADPENPHMAFSALLRQPVILFSVVMRYPDYLHALLEEYARMMTQGELDPGDAAAWEEQLTTALLRAGMRIGRKYVQSKDKETH